MYSLVTPICRRRSNTLEQRNSLFPGLANGKICVHIFQSRQQHLHHLGAKVMTRTCTWSFSLFSQKLKLQPSLSVSSMNFHPSIWRRRSNTMVWKKCKCKAKLLFNVIDMLVHQISSWKGMPQIKRECQSGLLHIRPHSGTTLLRVRPPSWWRVRKSIVP